MTLLDKARAYQPRRGRGPALEVTREHIDLAIAYLRGDVRTSQLAVALGVDSLTTARTNIVTYLREGVRMGLIDVRALGGDDASAAR